MVNETLATAEFGTAHMSSLALFELLMAGRAPVVRAKNADGSYYTLERETEAARQKQEQVREKWESWLWSDPARADQLATIYNRDFNRTVTHQFNGDHMTFPGMSPAIALLRHQKSAVWRGIQERNALLDHVVGAGKTFEMATMAMEMRRLGISRKPLFAVPNHLTLQWRSEFYRLYPGANVLAATPEDFAADNRKRMFAKIVTGDWDAVIIGHSSLKKVGLPQATEAAIVKEQADEIANAIRELKQERGDRGIVSQMEKIKANLDVKLRKLREKGGEKDDVVNFDELGVDALFVDEMHEFKNLFFTSQMQRVSGLGNPAGSGKAFDLFVKIRWLKDTFGEKAPLVTATGTPVSNSLSEMFTMQRYMQYQTLKDQGLHLFDPWAKQYGQIENVYEVAPSGVGYRVSQRFSKFKNLPNLIGNYQSFADVVTLDDLKQQEREQGKSFPVPKIKGGKPQNVVVKRSAQQQSYFGVPELMLGKDGQPVFEIDLNEPVSVTENNEGKWVVKAAGFYGQYDTQADAVAELAAKAVTPRMQLDPDSLLGRFANLRQLTRATKGKVNPLSLTSLANKCGLDFRLIDPDAPDHPGSKINAAVRNITQTWQEWAKDKGTQLVFCDLSVPISARAKLANKDKRLFVRDSTGELTHKKGTLHTVEGYEGFPFYLVKPPKQQISVYEPVTGAVLKADFFATKKEAIAWVKSVLAQETGREHWIDLRVQGREITDEELQDYRDKKGFAEEEEGDSNEISGTDLEGVSTASHFSVYDDMKAKLVAAGIPESEIAFIHDFDTPTAKDLLFKRVNAGDVRVLFGSTPKMGAGTNVQKRLVALHHIDAPWRPSDLEQREGRIIRRGNALYERDPEGFEVGVYRYATEQTYDTRRWQLLEHKAAGIEQLRKYAGEAELEDVTTEAANAADMKAAASGNPLILKETQLRTEMKRLSALEKAEQDSRYMMQMRINSNRRFIEATGPGRIDEINRLLETRDRSTTLLKLGKHRYNTTEAANTAMSEVVKKLGFANLFYEYKGLKFEMRLAKRAAWDGQQEIVSELVLPNGATAPLDTVSGQGLMARARNFATGLESRLADAEHELAQQQAEMERSEAQLKKPFEFAAKLVAVRDEYRRISRALMQSSATESVRPEQQDAFYKAVDAQKAKLRDLGYGEVVDQLNAEERSDPAFSRAGQHAKTQQMSLHAPQQESPLRSRVSSADTEVSERSGTSREGGIKNVLQELLSFKPKPSMPLADLKTVAARVRQAFPAIPVV